MATSDIFNLTDTWNAGATTFTAIKMNVTDTASASASLLMDLQVGGTSQLSLDKSGNLTFKGNLQVANNGVYIEGTSLGTVRVPGVGGYFGFTTNTSSTSASTIDLFLGRAAAASLRLGAADAAAPVAQTLGVQSVVAGTSNTAGANLTIRGSAGTGTGAGGSIIFQVAPAGSSGTAQNAFSTVFTVAGDSTVIVNSGFLQIGNTSTNYFRSISGTATNFNGAFAATTSLGITSSISGAADVLLARDAANTLALRNGTSAQRFNIYGTYTAADNFERLFAEYNSAGTAFRIGTEKGSGGGTARNLELQFDGTTQITLKSGETLLGAGASPLITMGHSSASTSARIGFFGGVQIMNSTLGGGTAVRLSNGALTDVGGIQFGGTTSSFPALKRNSTALETKLADDSAYAPHAMQYLDVTDGITAPASATGRARIYVDTADGDLKVIFADGTVKTIVTDT